MKYNYLSEMSQQERKSYFEKMIDTLLKDYGMEMPRAKADYIINRLDELSPEIRSVENLNKAVCELQRNFTFYRVITIASIMTALNKALEK